MKDVSITATIILRIVIVILSVLDDRLGTGTADINNSAADVTGENGQALGNRTLLLGDFRFS